MVTNTSLYFFKEFPNSLIRCPPSLLIYIIYLDVYYSVYVYIRYTKVKNDYFNLTNTWNMGKSHQPHLLLFKLFFLTWTRIIFKGKGFRVRVFRETKKLTLNFGHSHWTKLLCCEYWDFFKIRRQNYLFLTTHKFKYYLLYMTVSQIKKINKYTLRGLRFKKQSLNRRFGKISQYVSSLH